MSIEQYNNMLIRGIKKSWNFATTKPQSQPIRLINQNLQFDLGAYKLQVLPFHPKLYSKNAKSTSISKQSYVLFLMFLQNDFSQSNQAWKNRKNFGFKFHTLGQLLEVRPHTNAVEVIEQEVKGYNKQEAVFKKLHLTDNPARKEITVCLEQKGNQEEARVETAIKYAHYQLIYKIVELSLFDFSGMRLTLEHKRVFELNKLHSMMEEESKKKTELDDIFQSTSNSDMLKNK